MMFAPQAIPATVTQAVHDPVDVMVSCFTGSANSSEYNFMLKPVFDASFEQQLAWLEAALQDTLSRNGLDRSSIVFRRFFCSETAGQVEALQRHAFSNPDGVVNGGISLVIQPPVQPANLALWVYCVSDTDGQLSGNGSSVTLRRGELEHYWSTGLMATEKNGVSEQTRVLFDRYTSMLEAEDMNLRDNCLRTWFYIRDVDHNYAGFVTARNAVFAGHGLTSHSHYIASTGIQASLVDENALLMMETYAVKGLQPDQVRHLKALGHLSNTDAYGVAFERATEVAYRDRRHIIVSGTASIDARGNVVHDGDVERQLQRALENVSALLARANASLNDMQHFVAYVRRPDDAGIIHELLTRCVGGKPFLVVTGPVCRPEWLVEIEGIAIVPNDDNCLPAY